MSFPPFSLAGRADPVRFADGSAWQTAPSSTLRRAPRPSARRAASARRVGSSSLANRRSSSGAGRGNRPPVLLLLPRRRRQPLERDGRSVCLFARQRVAWSSPAWRSAGRSAAERERERTTLSAQLLVPSPRRRGAAQHPAPVHRRSAHGHIALSRARSPLYHHSCEAPVPGFASYETPHWLAFATTLSLNGPDPRLTGACRVLPPVAAALSRRPVDDGSKGAVRAGRRACAPGAMQLGLLGSTSRLRWWLSRARGRRLSRPRKRQKLQTASLQTSTRSSSRSSQLANQAKARQTARAQQSQQASPSPGSAAAASSPLALPEVRPLLPVRARRSDSSPATPGPGDPHPLHDRPTKPVL